jgi:hypothetical protein
MSGPPAFPASAAFPGPAWPRGVARAAQNGTLRFTVSDDGTGYDARHTRWDRACGTWRTGSQRPAGR